jgi:hypothetical protein
MINLPEFNLALWAIENPASDKSPTHQGSYTDEHGRKWAVVAWHNEEPGLSKKGNPRPNISVKIDESKYKAVVNISRPEIAGSNVVDNPAAQITEQLARLDEAEQRLDRKLAMLERIEELEAALPQAAS